MHGMVIVVLCTDSNTCARESRNSSKCKEYKTKIGSLKQTTKRILRWLNHDHMLPPLYASSQFTIYSIILDMPVSCETVAFCPMHLLLENTCTRIHSTLEIWQYQLEPNNQSEGGILMQNRNVVPNVVLEIHEPLIKGKPKNVAEIFSWIKFGWQHYIPRLLGQQLVYHFACLYRIMASLWCTWCYKSAVHLCSITSHGINILSDRRKWARIILLKHGWSHHRLICKRKNI